MQNDAITLAITGASGAQYGLRLLEQLLLAKQNVYLVFSKPARIVVKMEMGITLPSHTKDIQDFFIQRYHANKQQLQVFNLEQWTAPIASGSAISQAMVICPCTSGTLASIASGLSRNLIERAADVTLKEQRQLILVHRETPVSAIHLENMLKLAKMGVTILPANPGFYHCPQTVDDIVDFVVARILDHLKIKHHLSTRWGQKEVME